MSNKQTRPSASAQHTEMPDDFKRIKGIGQATDRRLHAAGIQTFAQLAALSPHDVVQVLDGAGISVERVMQQDWIGAAQALASAATPSSQATGRRDEPERDARQHYAVYTVKLLQNEDNEVRYTEVQNVNQAEDKDNWPGWDEQALIQFLAGSAKIKLPTLPAAPNVPDTPAPIIVPAEVKPIDTAVVPAKSCAIAIRDIAVDAAEVNPSMDASTAPKLRAMIAFELSGAEAQSIIAVESPYSAWVTVREESSLSLISLDTSSGRLGRNGLRYTTQVDFDMPPAGRYQMIGMVQLQDQSLLAIKAGPWFRVKAG